MSFIITWLAGKVGANFAKPVFFAGCAILIAIIAFTLAKCSEDHTAERQAEQTTKSGEAFANSATTAIEIIGNRTVTDATVDQAVADTQRNINDAENPDLLRGAVIDRVCRSPSHRSDPACAVR